MADPRDLPARHVAGAVDLSSLVERHQRPDPRGGGQPGPSAPSAAPGSPSSQPAAGDPRDAAGEPPLPAPGEAIASLPDVVLDGAREELEQFTPLSQFVPVLIEMHAAWSHEARELSPVLAKVVRELAGRVVLLRIDLDAHPELGRQPQVLALLAGRPIQLFGGTMPEAELKQLLQEVLQVAAQQGIENVVAVEGAEAGQAAAPAEPAEPEIPEHLRAAYQAIERRDYPAAIAAYEQVIRERPADEEAQAGLAQVKLLDRLGGKTLDEIRSRAAMSPNDLEAQLDLADLDLSGGHVEDAFERLLDVFAETPDAEARTTIRERLLELFLVVGVDDPRVLKARQRLASLLF